MINRHNYEEFFLMYVDNELTPQQRADVELFVRHNPDLEAEFYLLQQTKLPPEDILEFGHKADLLKVKDSIGFDNYEEYFLLYVDGELNEESKAAVEKFVLQQPQLQEEFTLLKQTVLPQEKIVFADKRSLYRKEPGRVVAFSWMRIAAVAAFIAIAAMIWWLLPVNKYNNIAVVQPANEQVKPTQDNKQQQQQEKPAQPITKPSTGQDGQVATTGKTSVSSDKKAMTKMGNKNVVPQPTQKKFVPQDDNNIAINSQKNGETNNALPGQNIQDRKDAGINDDDRIVAINNDKSDNETTLDNTKPVQDIADRKLNNDLVKPAIYKELDTNDGYDNRSSLYVGNLELNKNKMRGIMKKVGGMFAGKSKTILANEEGKLRVANIELNTN